MAVWWRLCKVLLRLAHLYNHSEMLALPCNEESKTWINQELKFCLYAVKELVIWSPAEFLSFLSYKEIRCLIFMVVLC